MSKHNLPVTINLASRRKACFPGDCMRRTAAMSLLFVEMADITVGVNHSVK